MWYVVLQVNILYLKKQTWRSSPNHPKNQPYRASLYQRSRESAPVSGIALAYWKWLHSWQAEEHGSYVSKGMFFWVVKSTLDVSKPTLSLGNIHEDQLFWLPNGYRGLKPLGIRPDFQEPPPSGRCLDDLEIMGWNRSLCPINMTTLNLPGTYKWGSSL